MNRDRAESHPPFLVAVLTHAEPFFLMAMRAGRKQELKMRSSASADFCNTSPQWWAGNGPTATTASLLTQATACCAGASTSSCTALLNTNAHFYWRTPKRFRSITLSITRCAYLTSSQLKSWVGPTNSPFSPPQALSCLLYEIWVFQSVPITMYNIKLQPMKTNTQFY